MKARHITWLFCRGCLLGTCTTAIWLLWLLLGVLLAFQIRIVSSHEMAAPEPVLRMVERRLATHGLGVKFGQARMDSAGRVELHDVVLSTTAPDEPLLSASSLGFTIDPWSLLVGDVTVNNIQLSGASLHLPAMLSPSGTNEPVITNIEAGFSLKDHRLEVGHFSARFDRLAISARGAVSLPDGGRAKTQSTERIPLAVDRYLSVFRRVAAYSTELAAFDQPQIDVVLEATPGQAAVADVCLSARGARWPASRFKRGSDQELIEVGPFVARTRQPLAVTGARPVRIDGEFTTLDLPRISARGLRFAVDAEIPASGPFFLRRADVIASELTASNIRCQAVRVAIMPQENSRQTFRCEMNAYAFDATWTLVADADFAARAGHFRIDGAITRPLIAFAGEALKIDLPSLVQPENPAPFNVEAGFDAGWKIATVRGAFATGPVVARRVPLDATRAEFFYDGREVLFDRVLLKTGLSEARGSYWMDTRTLDFRFLLEGGLQPPAIAGWFSEWWPRFWTNFDFGSAVPVADVDVRGRWRHPNETTVFIYVDSRTPRIKDVSFARVRTTLFIRPDYYEALDLIAERPEGVARGTFTRAVDLEAGAMRRMEFSVTSELEVSGSARVFGKTGIELVQPFVFERPPRLVITGRLDGPASPSGEHQMADVTVVSAGGFGFHGFPLRNLSVRARLRDDDLMLEDLGVEFAGGRVTGKARLTGREDVRRLGFDIAINGARLGEAIGTLEKYGASRRGEAPPPQSKFQQRAAAGRLGLRISADGDYRDLFSFKGAGSAEIDGAELAEVNLLGALSRVLNFTSLRLDAAHSNFKLDGPRLAFSELRITGPKAAIEAKGIYRLDAGLMDFNARVFPFEESGNFLASAIDFVLTPLSSVLELKLTGNLEHPDWRFAFGPTSILRGLTGEKDMPKDLRPNLLPGLTTPPPAR